MGRCYVLQCKNRPERKTPNITFHRFPQETTLRALWIQATGRKNWEPDMNVRICSMHFESRCFRNTKTKTYLNPNSIPSLSVVHCQDNKKSIVSFEQPSTSQLPVDHHYVSGEQSGSTSKSMDIESSSTDCICTVKKTIKVRRSTSKRSGQRCSVLQCKSGSAKNIILHSCPHQEAVQKKWAEVFKVNREVVKNMLICSQHFLKTDYVSSKKGDTRILKQNAVPSQKLPRSTRIISVRKKVLHCKNKHVRPKPPKKVEKMSDSVDEKPNVNKHENTRECRACLKTMENSTSVCNIFQCWVPPWAGMEATIAEDLAKLANIQVMETDNHSKIICEPCYCKLLDASNFVANVRHSDQILRQRHTELNNADKVWPKPIQVDKNINSNVFQDMDIEIKQEIVSDEENAPNTTENSYVQNATENYNTENNDPEYGNLDIKVEPEEFVEQSPSEEASPFVEPPPLTIMINGTMSLKSSDPENKTLVNGTDEYEAIITEGVESTALSNGNGELHTEHHLETTVKEEPLSEEEDFKQDPDLSLECLLCTKLFNSVTGLKAHVIAHHSYKSVKRKALNAQSPEKRPKNEHQCEICRRRFLTSTDLMVHETCHNKHSCYGCMRKFDTFKQLSKHRKRCHLPLNKPVVKPKTLDDVKRHVKEENIDSPDLSSVDKNEAYLNDSSMKLNVEILSSQNEIPIIKKEIEDPDVSETDSHMEILNSDFT